MPLLNSPALPTNWPRINLELEEEMNAPKGVDTIYERSNLTRDQLLVWVGQKLQPDVPLYNMAYTFAIFSKIEYEHFQRAFQTLIDSSDTLRTVIQEVDGVPQQRTVEKFPYPVEYLDFSGSADADARLQDWVRHRCGVPFDLEKRSFDCALVKIQDQKHVWYFSQHHIVCDGTSFALIHRHMSELYGQSLRGCLRQTPALPAFSEYIREHRAYVGSRRFRVAEEYWKRKLADSPDSTTFYCKRPLKQTTRVRRIAYHLDAQRSQKLRDAAAREDIFVKTASVSLFNIFAAILSTYLYRVSGMRMLSLGTPFHNRTSAAVRETLGFFMQVLPLHIEIGPEDTFLSLIGKIRAEATEMLQYRPFTVANSVYRRAYDVLLNYYPAAATEFAGAQMETEWIHPGHENNCLALQIANPGSSGDFVFYFDFHLDYFQEHQFESAIEHFVKVLDAFLDDPAQLVRGVRLLSSTEETEILEGFNQTQTPFPAAQTLSGLITKWAERTPNQTAIVSGRQTLSYAELEARSNQLARYLQRHGAKIESLIGIGLERSADTVVAVLGILKAGAAYVPLDSSSPAERLASLLADADVPLIITTSGVAGRLPHSARVLCLDIEPNEIADESELPLDAGVTPDNLACVIYTSGSTGQPKGVEITHRALVNFTTAALDEFEITQNDRVLQFAAICFDAAAEEIFPCLGRGATLVMRTESMLDSVTSFLSECRELGLTVLDLPTAYWHTLTEEMSRLRLEVPPDVRLVIIGGEQALQERAAQWQKLVKKSTRLINSYGPTETTVVATMWQLPATSTGQLEEVPIGKPIHNVQTYVLDDYLKPVPIGVCGELHIGGEGLARGYHNDPELTSKRFIPNPFSDQPGSRLYKTGDLARYLPDGNIEFLGRGDRQVKIRGFRIELGEIEAVLSQHPAVRQATVTANEYSPGDRRLAAYVVLNPQALVGPGDLRSHLEQKLPAHMTPSVFFELDRLPLTPSGKVDRHILSRLGLAPPFKSEASESRSVNGGETLMAGVSDEESEKPQTELELRLAQIWENVLNVRPLGRDSNFFELGGHSLLAVHLFAQIEKFLGMRLPLATLFQSPTIRQLATVLTEGGWKQPWSALVPIRCSGCKRPFFCVHGIGGTVLNYEALARHLGPDQPFYGLQSLGLEGQQTPHRTIEAMAAHYVEAIRSAQPEGPYFIGGMSFGGVVAFEMAHQLQREGQEVGCLALLDTSAEFFSEGVTVIDRLKSHLAALRNGGFQQRRAYLRQLRKSGRRKLRSRVWRVRYKWELRRHRQLSPELRDVKEMNFLAAKEYRLRPFCGNVSLFRSNQHDIRRSNPLLGWKKFASGVDLYCVPGDHISIVNEPHVRVLAEQLTLCLARAAGTLVMDEQTVA